MHQLKSFPADASSSIASTLRELQRDMLFPLWAALYVLGACSILLTEGLGDTQRWGVLGSLLIILATVSVLVAWRIRYDVGVWVAVAVSMGLITLCLHWFRVEILMSLYAVIVGVAALMTSTRGAVGVATLSTALLLVSHRTGIGRDESLFIAVVCVWSTVLIVWGSAHMAHTVAEWSWASHVRSNDLLEGLRSRQVQLLQIQQDLADANLQLTRLDERLQAMYHVAEEARRAKEEFVARVSHELRTPLNMIIGFSEMITRSPQLYGESIPEALLADIAVVHRNSQHLSNLVDDVLDLSQAEAGHVTLYREWAALHEIVDEATVAVQPLFDSKGLYLRAAVPKELPHLFCDRTRIRQVVLNLLSNAGRFTEHGGVQVQARQHDDHVVLSVADTGPGIAPEDQDKLFQPFQQLDGSARRRHGGSGLGLAISRKFVELHSGKIWVESNVGAGATFLFSLPVETAPSTGEGVSRWFGPYYHYEPRLRRSAAPLAEIGPRYVVLEEGNTLEGTFARYMPGAEVVAVHSTSDALEQVERSPAQALVVNDASLREALVPLAGFPALPHHTPVVVCSVPGKDQVAKELGACDYLVKPVDRRALLATLGRLATTVRTVLLVDDEPDALRLLTRMLVSAERGYRLLRASSGQQALDLMREHHPDVMLLDLAMPGMSGLQVLEEKNRDAAVKDIPFIVVTARDPLEEAIVSPALLIARGRGLSVREIIACTHSISEALAPPSRAGDRAHPERSSDSPAYAPAQQRPTRAPVPPDPGL